MSGEALESDVTRARRGTRLTSGFEMAGSFQIYYDIEALAKSSTMPPGRKRRAVCVQLMAVR